MRPSLLAACAVFLLLPAQAAAVLVYQRGTADDLNAPIVVAGNDGSHPRVVATGFDPQVSPTGKRVAYFTYATGGDTLNEVGVDGTGRRKLVGHTTGHSPPRAVAWSHDEHYVVVADAQRLGLKLVDRRQRKIFLRNTGDHGGASFGPGSKLFAVESVGETESGIAIASVSSLKLRGPVTGFAPAWGPPGLAFAREHKILLRRRPGEPARTILREAFPIARPVDWSANGHRLLIDESPSGVAHRAAVIGLESKKVTRIPTRVSAVRGISNDGHAVLAEMNGDLVALHLDGTKLTLVSNAANATWTK